VVSFSLRRSIEAAVAGQTHMSALTGRPGNRVSPVVSAIGQNGTESAKTKRTNFRGDLLRVSMLFDKASCGNARICGFCGVSLSGERGRHDRIKALGRFEEHFRIVFRRTLKRRSALQGLVEERQRAGVDDAGRRSPPIGSLRPNLEANGDRNETSFMSRWKMPGTCT